MSPHKMIVSLFALLLGSSLPAPARQAGPKTIRFSGYEWEVRPVGSGGPGPNRWEPNNVRVDSQGQLHLKLTRTDGVWRCAEVSTKKRLGFGTYQFQVRGPVDRFDQNVVLGLFNYTTPELGPDGTNEIDIEFAHWGDPKWPMDNYTVYPTRLRDDAMPPKPLPKGSKALPFSLTGDTSTHRFTWTAESVDFQGLHGYRNDNQKEFAHWRYAPDNAAQLIPQQPLPIHINLWLLHGKPPTDDREIEIVIRRFTFTPLSSSTPSRKPER